MGEVTKRFAFACFTLQAYQIQLIFNPNGTHPGTTFVNSSIVGGGPDDRANALQLHTI